MPIIDQQPVHDTYIGPKGKEGSKIRFVRREIKRIISFNVKTLQKMKQKKFLHKL